MSNPPTINEAIENRLINREQVRGVTETFTQTMNANSFMAIRALILIKYIYGSDMLIDKLAEIQPIILDEILRGYNPNDTFLTLIGDHHVLIPSRIIAPELSALFGCMNIYPRLSGLESFGELNPSNYSLFSKALKEIQPFKWKIFIKKIAGDTELLKKIVNEGVESLGLMPRPPPVFVQPQPKLQTVPSAVEMQNVAPPRPQPSEPLIPVNEKPKQTVVVTDDDFVKPKVISEEEWTARVSETGSDSSSEDDEPVQPREEPEERPKVTPEEKPVPAPLPTYTSRLRESDLRETPDVEKVLMFEHDLFNNPSEIPDELVRQIVDLMFSHWEEELDGTTSNPYCDLIMIAAFDIIYEIRAGQKISPQRFGTFTSMIMEVANLIDKTSKGGRLAEILRNQKSERDSEARRQLLIHSGHPEKIRQPN